ncbi:MAG: universal stress protein [Dehalococcoidia bacterium]|nr:universal stress protein [Dehalococcoidia bacterium]
MANKSPLLVAIDNSSASLEALELATTLAKAQKVPVYAVHVIEVLRSLPVNAEMEWEARQGENLLRRAEERVPGKDVAFTGELLQSRQAGQAIR